MRLELPKLRDTPCIWDALAWLLGLPSDPGNRWNILVRARLCGLIISDSSPYWKADGVVADRLAKAGLRRLPRDPQELGRVLYGLGEIDARATTDLSQMLANYLPTRRPRRSLYEVLDAAAGHEAKRIAKPQLSEIDLAQWISRARLTWDSFDSAIRRVKHPDILIGASRYGLKFAAGVVSMVDPRAIDAWILHHPNRMRTAVIGSAALPTFYAPDMAKRATLLVRSRVPAIRCLAAALHVCPPIPVEEFASLRDCVRTLIANGIDPADATWMGAYRIKNAVHSRYWTHDRLQGRRTRARSLRENPNAAMGGPHNFNAEMRALEREIEERDKTLSGLEVQIEEMLSELAIGWPSDGLSDEQMEDLDNNFVNTPEIRHRLAMKIVHRPNRDWLLRRNIEQLCGLIGLSRKPSDILNVYFNAEDVQLDRVIPWAAQSLILLYTGDRRGIGKRTSDLVAGMSSAFEALAAEPFSAARTPIRWQSALARAASGYLFALIVVAAVPEAQRAEVEQLNQMVIDHVCVLLCARNPDARSLQLLFKLITRTILHMAFSPDGDKERQRWAANEKLPAFARAMALWSSVTLVDKDAALAVSLFKSAAELPLSRAAQGLQMSQMLTLVDLAVATSARANRSDLVRQITALWSEVYQDWQPFFGQWANAAELMIRAVEQEGAERQEFLAEQSFVHTHCRKLIEERGGKAANPE